MIILNIHVHVVLNYGNMPLCLPISGVGVRGGKAALMGRRKAVCTVQ